MKAMQFEKVGQPLQLVEREATALLAHQILLSVKACGICRTDLHIIDGELNQPNLPLILGHQIVAEIKALGADVTGFTVGQRVGVPWLGQTCGHCKFCLSGRENLCDHALFTGYTVDGGYASEAIVNSQFCFVLPEESNYLSDTDIAPLLCAGLIGWRTLKLAGDAKRIGVYGFGAAAHIVIQVALYQGREVYAFTRDGDSSGQEFARKLGASWAGGSSQLPPEKLDAALIFAPAGELVPLALLASDKGAAIVCGGIHMSTIPSFSYDLLWEERSIRSVANLTRVDAEEFFAIAFKIPIKTNVTVYQLEEANQALSDLRQGKFKGAAALSI
ncbi:MAG: alcohol dehydrogenase [Cyanobacteria bacterium PR.023]|nr:alcohol dehydrogenase [Cyanobacteria bacterium PR.023]